MLLVDVHEKSGSFTEMIQICNVLTLHRILIKMQTRPITYIGLQRGVKCFPVRIYSRQTSRFKVLTRKLLFACLNYSKRICFVDKCNVFHMFCSFMAYLLTIFEI